jgi:hypothetical protein
MMKPPIDIARVGAVSVLALAIAACGDGGGATGGPTADAGGRGTIISGSIVKGPVSGARVCAYELTPSGKGREVGCADSRADGSYDLAVEHQGAVIVEATGGTYVDEATGLPGVTLAAPLATMGEVAGTTATLVATPLTTLALHEAGRSGSLSLASFEVAAQQVRNAFGLGADVDLVRTRPDVSPGAINAYGRVLVGFSRMLKAGAELPRLFASADLATIKAAFENCSSRGGDPVLEIVSALTTTARPGGPHALIDVFQPTAAWRGTLPTTGPLGHTGCALLENSAERVRLSCDPTTPRAAVTFLTGSAAANGSYETAPASSALTLAGARIVVSGGELLTDPNFSVTIVVPEGTVQMGFFCQLTPSAAIVAPTTGGGLILNQDTTLPVFVGLPNMAGGGSISIGSGSIGTSGAGGSPSGVTLSGQ